MKCSGGDGIGKGVKRMEESFGQFREGKKMKEEEKGFKWCVTPEKSGLSKEKQ